MSAWADGILVPTPVYFNDFSFAVNGNDDIRIVGSGAFETDNDARFGKFYHNDPNNTSAKRTNYLQLPANILSKSKDTKELTIGMWVNKKNENDFFWTPLFSAYGTGPNDVNTFPMLVCETRCLVQLNCTGYCDFGINDKQQGTSFNDGEPYMNTNWLDDGGWHYYTAVFTETTAKVYVDGVLKNGWTVDGTSEGQVISGLFSHGEDLKYICLGGNQAWAWDDADPAFGFDDFAVYNVALTQDQINQIRKNKLERTVAGTQIGAVDNSTEYVTTTSTPVKLYPGDSYHYNFINYNGGGTNNWNNWVLPVYNTSNERVITVRADIWEDMHHVGDTWGSNAGCTNNFSWGNFPANLNGATIDMTVSFTAEKLFTMKSTIKTVDGSTWSYDYKNDYANSPIDLTSNDYITVALSVSRSWLDILSEGVPVSISKYEWATFANANALDFSNVSGLSAYVVTGHKVNAIEKEAVTSVPASTGLLLNGTEGTYYVPVVSTATAPTENYLVAGTGVAVAKEDGKTKYALGVNSANKAAFMIIDDYAPVMAKNKAYLQFDEVISAPFLSFDGDGETTGIANVNVNANANSSWYDLSGRRVANPTKGLYIVNGKKVIIK